MRTKEYAIKALEVLRDQLTRSKTKARRAKIEGRIRHWEEFLATGGEARCIR